jgi:hypothetical protein
VERLGGLPSRLVCNGTGVVRVRTVGACTVEIRPLQHWEACSAS